MLAETASRNLAYVALTRGRESNHAYLYQRDSTDTDHSHDLAAGAEEVEGIHLARRGTPAQAARALRQVIGHDTPARTAHQIAADNTPSQYLPELVASLITEHQQAVIRRRSTYQKNQRTQQDRALNRHLGLDRSRNQHRDYDLSL
ncbi:putative relaxase [Mycobacteroides abscessus subsp. abscessus]|nr:putative relaxase [Mycobacteroides abscessus subsp. abscessus]